ncbi:hypothetical protein [Collimonas arenae]|uniref:hypothetical protein n=1 Tax=Collimonas arenae TaxID=279058 RepID=UPI0012E09566|nr:hypothetical protein [Collimonas arenae]
MKILILLFLLSVSSFTIAKESLANYSIKDFNLKYSQIFYSSATSDLVRNENPIIYNISFNMKKSIMGNSEDFGTLCFSDLQTCAQIDATSPLYFKTGDGEIHLNSITENVKKISFRNWYGFEAFPLCGITKNSISSNYGGQCYAIVLTNNHKTIAIQFFLGENQGCKDIRKCFSLRMGIINQFLKSISDKFLLPH